MPPEDVGQVAEDQATPPAADPTAAQPEPEPELETPVSAYPEVGGVRLAADFSNLAEWQAAADAAAVASATVNGQSVADDDTVGDPAGTTVDPTAPAAGATAGSDAGAPASGAPAPTGSADPATPPADAAPAFTAEQIEAMKQAGYKVEPPPPQPSEYEELTQRLAPLVSNETLNAHIAVLEQPLPPKPADRLMDMFPDDPAVVTYKEAVEKQEAARRGVAQVNRDRMVADIVIPWARHRTLMEHGVDIAALGERYPTIDRDTLARPGTLGNLFAALETAVSAKKDAEWKAREDALKKSYEGKLRLAEAGGTVSRADRIGTAPPPPPSQGATAPRPLYTVPTKVDPATGLRVWTEEALAAAREGRLT